MVIVRVKKLPEPRDRYLDARKHGKKGRKKHSIVSDDGFLIIHRSTGRLYLLLDGPQCTLDTTVEGEIRVTMNAALTDRIRRLTSSYRAHDTVPEPLTFRADPTSPGEEGTPIPHHDDPVFVW